MAKKALPPKYQVWVNARKKFHLSHAQIQMARELGMNPKRLGGKANHDQQKWKVPLPAFIEQRYERQFGKSRPDNVRSIEEMVKDKKQKQAARKARKAAEQAAEEETAEQEQAVEVDAEERPEEQADQ